LLLPTSLTPAAPVITGARLRLRPGLELRLGPGLWLDLRLDLRLGLRPGSRRGRGLPLLTSATILPAFRGAALPSILAAIPVYVLIMAPVAVRRLPVHTPPFGTGWRPAGAILRHGAAANARNAQTERRRQTDPQSLPFHAHHEVPPVIAPACGRMRGQIPMARLNPG
jgi:hypothetical protein